MAELKQLKQFTELFENVKRSIDYYSENLKNDIFTEDKTETKDDAYKRGETLFDQFDENLINLNVVIQKENEISDFFNKCKENKTKIIEQKNILINKLLNIKKNTPNITKQDYLNCKEDWNKRREETIDEKNRRECEEMLIEMKEEKKQLEEIKLEIENEKKKLAEMKLDLEKTIKKAIKQKENLDIEKEFHKIANKYVKKLDIPQTLNKEQYNLTSSQKVDLEEWTSMKCGDILFDSTKNSWDKDKSKFTDNIIGKKQLTFLIENETGDKFGYYLNTKVNNLCDNWMKPTDEKSFIFSLKTKNGRMKESMKFEINNYEKGGYCLYDTSDDCLMRLGDILLYKRNGKDKSYCLQDNGYFNYHDIKNAICGYSYPKKFDPKRIMVIQMI